MGAYAPYGQTEIANLALQEMGSAPITDIEDTNSNSALACNASFWQTVREVGQEHNWKCLQKRTLLTQLTFPGVSSSSSEATGFGWPGCQPSTPPPYWLADTAYTGGTLVTYGEAIYYCLQAYTSTSNFNNDATAGFWAQLYSSFFASQRGNTGGMYEWKFGYGLAPDYLLLTELNGVDCRRGRGNGQLYELFINQTVNSDQTVSNQKALFCNDPFANIKYTAFIQDPTVWDPLFIGCVAVLLASKIATQVRGDDGNLSAQLRQRYTSDLLPKARLKDAGQQLERRYDPTKSSNWLRSRYGSTAG